MKFIVKDHEAKVVMEGDDVVAAVEEINERVPTHGSLHLEVLPGKWLNVKTSEWLIVTLAEAPKGWREDRE